MFIKGLHWSLSFTGSVQSVSPHPISLKFILGLLAQPCLGLPSGFYPCGFPTNMICTYAWKLVCAYTHKVNVSNNYKHKCPHHMRAYEYTVLDYYFAFSVLVGNMLHITDNAALSKTCLLFVISVEKKCIHASG
jgi:hypothetical protein